MHNLKCKFEGSGIISVMRHGVVRAEIASGNMLLDGFFTKLLALQPLSEVKATLKVGMGIVPSEKEMTQLVNGLQPTSGVWPTAYLSPDGIAEVVGNQLVVNGFFNYTCLPGQIVGPVTEYGVDLAGSTRADQYGVDTRVVMAGTSDLVIPLIITAEDQLMVSYKIAMKMDLVQPSVNLPIDVDGQVVNHQVRLHLGTKGTILDYLNILGSTPAVGNKVNILISPEVPLTNLTPFTPEVFADMGLAKVVTTDGGIHIPVRIGEADGFPTGIKTIYPSGLNSWYQLVVTPAIQKSPQQVVKLAIGQGMYTPEDDSVVTAAPAKKWLLPGQNIYFNLIENLSHDATPVVDNGEMQLILTYGQSSKAPMGAELPLGETGYFTTCDFSSTFIEEFKLGFGMSSFTGKHTNYPEIEAEYTLSTYFKFGENVIEYVYPWYEDWGEPVPRRLLPDGTIGEPNYDNRRYEVSRLVGYNTVYAGETFIFPMVTSEVTEFSEVLGLIDISEYYDSSYPTTGYKAPFGHGKWGVKLTHKTNPAMSLSLEHDFWITPTASTNGSWLYSQSDNTFIPNKPFDASNITVSERDGLQLAIGAYLNSPRNANGIKAIDFTQGDPNLTPKLELAPGDDIYVTFGVGAISPEVLANYEVYLYIGVRGSSGTGVALKCIPSALGDLNWYEVYADGTFGLTPELIDHGQLIPNQVGVCGFSIANWFAPNIGDFKNTPQAIGGKRLLGDYDLRMLAKPKTTAHKPIVLTRYMQLVKSIWVYADNGWIIGPDYGLFWFSSQTDIARVANQIAQAGVAVFAYDNYIGTNIILDGRERVPLTGNRFVVPGNRAVVTIAADVFQQASSFTWNLSQYYDVILELTLSDGILRRAKYQSDASQNHRFVPESVSVPGTFPTLPYDVMSAFYEHNYTSGHAEGGPVALVNQAAFANTADDVKINADRTWLDETFLTSGNLAIDLTNEVFTLSVRMVRIDGQMPDLLSTVTIELTA